MGGILGRRAWERSSGGLWLPNVLWSPVQMGFCCCTTVVYPTNCTFCTEHDDSDLIVNLGISLSWSGCSVSTSDAYALTPSSPTSCFNGNCWGSNVEFTDTTSCPGKTIRIVMTMTFNCDPDTIGYYLTVSVYDGGTLKASDYFVGEHSYASASPGDCLTRTLADEGDPFVLTSSFPYLAGGVTGSLTASITK